MLLLLLLVLSQFLHLFQPIKVIPIRVYDNANAIANKLGVKVIQTGSTLKIISDGITINMEVKEDNDKADQAKDAETKDSEVAVVSVTGANHLSQPVIDAGKYTANKINGRFFKNGNN